VNKNRKTVIEINVDLHQKIRKLAILNDLKIYVLANAIIEDMLSDQEKTTALIKRLKLWAKLAPYWHAKFNPTHQLFLVVLNRTGAPYFEYRRFTTNL